jgi:hypothetical protein
MKEDEKKIIFDKDKILTREEIFEGKERFHQEQAKLPFEEKIKILVKLQKIARSIKGKGIVWEIESLTPSPLSQGNEKYNEPQENDR